MPRCQYHLISQKRRTSSLLMKRSSGFNSLIHSSWAEKDCSTFMRISLRMFWSFNLSFRFFRRDQFFRDFCQYLLPVGLHRARRIEDNILAPQHRLGLFDVFLWLLLTDDCPVDAFWLFGGATAGFVNYTPTPDAVYPQQINEIYAALKWVVENTERN